MEHVHKVTEVREVPADEHVGPAVVFARLIYFVFGVVAAFIVLRMLLLMLAANPGNAFVDFVYGVSGFFVAPFYGVFGHTPEFGAAIFDLSSVVALLVYALVAWALVALVTLSNRTSSTEV